MLSTLKQGLWFCVLAPSCRIQHAMQNRKIDQIHAEFSHLVLRILALPVFLVLSWHFCAYLLFMSVSIVTSWHCFIFHNTIHNMFNIKNSSSTDFDDILAALCLLATNQMLKIAHNQKKALQRISQILSQNSASHIRYCIYKWFSAHCK